MEATLPCQAHAVGVSPSALGADPNGKARGENFESGPTADASVLVLQVMQDVYHQQ